MHVPRCYLPNTHSGKCGGGQSGRRCKRKERGREGREGREAVNTRRFSFFKNIKKDDRQHFGECEGQSGSLTIETSTLRATASSSRS